MRGGLQPPPFRITTLPLFVLLAHTRVGCHGPWIAKTNLVVMLVLHCTGYHEDPRFCVTAIGKGDGMKGLGELGGWFMWIMWIVWLAGKPPQYFPETRLNFYVIQVVCVTCVNGLRDLCDLCETLTPPPPPKKVFAHTKPVFFQLGNSKWPFFILLH
jgi:hypothetical protein